jgi:hypothetical protein
MSHGEHPEGQRQFPLNAARCQAALTRMQGAGDSGYTPAFASTTNDTPRAGRSGSGFW